MWKVSTSLKQPTSAFTAARLSRFHTDQGSRRDLRGLLHCPQIKRTSCRAVNAYLSSIPSTHSIWLVCVGSLQKQGARHASHDSNFLSLNFRTELGFIYPHICCFSKEKSMRAFVIGLSLTISINNICLFCTWKPSLTKRIHNYPGCMFIKEQILWLVYKPDQVGAIPHENLQWYLLSAWRIRIPHSLSNC